MLKPTPETVLTLDEARAILRSEEPSPAEHFALLQVHIRAAAARLEAALWTEAEQELEARLDG